MSQFQIAMKKNLMRKNKKLVMNIALSKEGLASRFEADQEDLASSRDEEKERFESSERRRDLLFQRVFSSKAQKIDVSIDDHSCVGDGMMMREVDVGTGLSGALKLLREQGTFKEGKSSKLATSVTDKREDERFRDRFKDIRIDRVDECGRILTQKEAFRALSHGFHGKQPGKRKQEKRKKKHEDKSKQMESSDRALERMRQVHAKLKSPCIVL